MLGRRGKLVRNERGAAIALMAASLVAVLGMGAVAVDLGMLMKARSDAQRAADAAALAGASAYLDCMAPFPAADSAKARAKAYAAKNRVGSYLIDTTTVSNELLLNVGNELVVRVIPDSFKVRTIVSRDSIGLLFARIFGQNIAKVSAMAAAEAAEAGAMRCIKPWAIPDQGYSIDDLGQLDTLKIPSDEPLDVEDSWFYAIQLPPHDPGMKTTCAAPKGESIAQGTEERWGECPEEPGTGSCWYRSYICNDNCQEVTLDMVYPVEKGNMIGPTAQGLNDILMSDPLVEWDPVAKQLERNGIRIEPGETRRAIKVGLYDPDTYTHPDQYTIQLTGFAYFFLEDGPHTYKGRPGLYDPDQAESVVGRFLYYAEGTSGGSATTPFTRVLRLVE